MKGLCVVLNFSLVCRLYLYFGLCCSFQHIKRISFYRLLIAYDNGLIVLWDVSEDKVVVVRGNKDLQLKGETVVHSSQSARPEHSENLQDNEEAEKEISSLCWASTDGSVLAVGYVDGDIMFWNLPTDASTKDQKAENSSNNVVKLQLSSADRRLPVIVLHWSTDRSHNGGQLFVYGGDGIGSEEVLTVCFQTCLAFENTAMIQNILGTQFIHDGKCFIPFFWGQQLINLNRI